MVWDGEVRRRADWRGRLGMARHLEAGLGEAGLALAGEAGLGPLRFG